MNSPKDRSDWVELLETMYEEQMHSTSQSIDEGTVGEVTAEAIIGSMRLETIDENAELTPMELDTSVKFLDGAGLIEATYGTDDELVNVGLTEEGLRLAHQIKTERQRGQTNRYLLWLTAVLAVLTVGLLGIELVRVGIF
jgi:DNA-binding MarR family transcriptional regulator